MKKCLWTCGFHKVITNRYQHSKREKSHILDVHFRSLFFPFYPFFLKNIIIIFIIVICIIIISIIIISVFVLCV